MMTDGTTTFVNASACTVNFLPMNPPIVFDLPNPRTTWLEEARPKSPTTNQEKGAKKGRWGLRAERTINVNSERGQSLSVRDMYLTQHMLWSGRTAGSSLLFVNIMPPFLHPNTESKSRQMDKRRDAFLCGQRDISLSSFTALTIWCGTQTDNRDTLTSLLAFFTSSHGNIWTSSETTQHLVHRSVRV